MKTATHSVAPWRVEPARGTLYAWRIESSGTNNVVAFVAQTIGNNQIENANAKLIAAAPELLEACKAICAAVSDCLPISGNTNKLDVLYYKSKLLAIDQAASVCSQAILKAEGNA